MVHMNQRDRVLDYMERHGSITRDEARRKLGVYELSRRICDLKERGINISDENIKVKNRFGEFVTVKRYSIVKED